MRLPTRGLAFLFFADLLRPAVGNAWLRLDTGVGSSARANINLSERSLREFRGLRSFVAFLAEQPKQLKHLEWPGFRNMLRMATLTLILVAAFLVVLSSVDAALCYILSWVLQKSA
ncbi:hypothetical protein GUJ93_ZPchr0009g1318 [Zizania palustris]|uniref:Preprotein translocase subunit SecE n=1 Tax=Zizania palustris TaxID=103762 RepID=A0A8J5V3C1_ZIZPA|nr:hypothetical protein GUJ93_ZPchr0009g1318 [Zizania palustris]